MQLPPLSNVVILVSLLLILMSHHKLLPLSNMVILVSLLLILNALAHFSLVSNVNQLYDLRFDLQHKSNDWFLYEMQHWAEMG